MTHQDAQPGRTVSQTIEDAAHQALLRSDDAPARFVVTSFDSGGYGPGVDLEDNSALLDLMETG